jgi:hypothetical protein
MITNPSAGRGLCSAVQSLENSVKNSNIKKRAMHEGIMEYFFFFTGYSIAQGILECNYRAEIASYDLLIAEMSSCVRSVENLTERINATRFNTDKSLDRFISRRIESIKKTIENIPMRAAHNSLHSAVMSYITNIHRDVPACYMDAFVIVGRNLRDELGKGIECMGKDTARLTPNYMKEINAVYNVFIRLSGTRKTKR